MSKTFLAAFACTLLALPALAADDVIYNGIDPWRTHGDGSTYRDFAAEPIPAGFFCAASEPFTGKIVFRGVPIETSPKGVLGLTDTILERLDDARFNEDGIAYTRLQVRALSFAATEAIETACGRFDVRVTLAGDQPITKMTIVRTSEDGGFFLSPVWVDVRLIFTPLEGKLRATPLGLVRSLRFEPAPNARWAPGIGASGARYDGFLAIDSNGDGKTDTSIPGTSNFGAGWKLGPSRILQPISPICHCDYETCAYQHCTSTF